MSVEKYDEFNEGKSIEEKLEPKAGQLQTKGSEVTAVILDEELDPIPLKFNYDNCVQIDTSELSYLTLNHDNLKTLSKLITEAENYFENFDWESEED